ncbi:MAG: hypothetical protein J5769_00505 [Bacteroidales bacterium]|nr:hypothetical protein [Bacteroidales bacterium]
MKNLYRLGILALCTCALLSCAKEFNSQNDENTEAIQEEETITRSITISQDTKSTIDGEGNISWENGDVIYYYSYYFNGEELMKSGKGTANITTAGQNVTVNLTMRAADQYLALLMPGKDGRDNNNAVQSYVPTAFGYTGINPDQDGSFAFANIAVAHSNDAHGVTSLTFKNITSILKFNVSASQNVKKVTMTPNTKTDGNQITGRITVDLTATNPSATYRNNYPNKDAARSYEAVIDKGNEAMDGTYYIAVMPTTLSDGFTLTFNDGEAQQIDGMTYTKQKYTAGTSSSVEFQANKIMNVGNPIENKRITSFTISQIATDNNWTTTERKSPFSVDNYITLTGSDGGDGNGQYNSTNNDWRCYQARNNGIFTVSCPEGRKISSITIKFNNVYSGVIQYNGNTYASPATITPVIPTNSIEFSVASTEEGRTNAQVRIKEVTVETK